MFDRYNSIFSICRITSLSCTINWKTSFANGPERPTLVARERLSVREDDNDYSWRGISRKLRPRFCDCVLDRPRVLQYSIPDESVRNVVATKWASIYTRYDWGYSTGNKSRSQHPSKRNGGQREREREKKRMSQRQYRGERGYVIYIGLKGLHKNVWSTKKDDSPVAATAPRDSTRLIVVKTTCPVRNTKDQSRIVKPGAAIALCWPS